MANTKPLGHTSRMNSIDSFTTSAAELCFAGVGHGSDAIFVEVDDVELDQRKGRRSIFPIEYRKNGDEVFLDLGEYGERRFKADDQVTWHMFRNDIDFDKA